MLRIIYTVKNAAICAWLYAPAEILIKIYTISGRLIKTIEGNLVNGDGFNKIHWDGRDEDGDEIANGVYPYKLILKNGNESKEKIEKLVVLR